MASVLIFIINLAVIIYYSLQNKKIGWIIFFAFIIRIIFNVIHHHIFILPAGCCDAIAFERYAWQWSNLDWHSFLLEFNARESYIISWIGGLIYRIFGREVFLLELMNINIATITVIYVYKASVLIMHTRYAKYATILFAFHPTVVEHSSVFMRETQIILLTTIAIYYFIRWYTTGNIKYYLYTIILIIMSMMFHGGLISGIFGIIIVSLSIIKNNYISVIKSKIIHKRTINISIILLIGTVIVALNGLPSLSTVGNLDNLTNTENATQVISEKSEDRARGRASYLNNLTPSSIIDLIWQTPIRIFYFLFSPFPWQISSITHIKGFIDSLFILYIISIIYRNRKIIKKIKIYKYIMIILIMYITAFSIATSNFGTAIRHKSKFIPIMVLFVGLKEYEKNNQNIVKR